MKEPNQEILDYLQSQRVGVLAIEMLDGSPHASTVHFAHTEKPLVFYFETDERYRKSEPLFGREKSRASMVIGADESNMKTVQMDGEAQLVTSDQEKKIFEDTYLRKFPEKKEKYGRPHMVLFTFTPTWWRFTDWTKPEGRFILSSD